MNEMNARLTNGRFTHVLWFVPPQVIKGTRESFARTGYWELCSWAHYEFREPEPEAPGNEDLPENADPAELAAWAGKELGHPVILELDADHWIKRGIYVAGRPVAISRKIRTPFYYVRATA